jgi:hypothetical protein
VTGIPGKFGAQKFGINIVEPKIAKIRVLSISKIRS